MARYDLYHTTTQTVHQTAIELTPQEAHLRNDLFREQKSPLRYILQHDPPAARCTCGAEYLFECICDHQTHDE